jgi:hypothetical protein
MRVAIAVLVISANALLAGCGGGGSSSAPSSSEGLANGHLLERAHEASDGPGPGATIRPRALGNEPLERKELQERIKEAAAALSGNADWAVDCVNGHGVWYCASFEDGVKQLAEDHGRVIEIESEWKIDPTSGKITQGDEREREAAE